MQQIHSDLYQYNSSKVLFNLYNFNLENFILRKRIVASMILFDVFKNVSNIKIAVFMNNKDYDGTVKRYADMNGFNIEMFFNENEAIQWLSKKEN